MAYGRLLLQPVDTPSHADPMQSPWLCQSKPQEAQGGCGKGRSDEKKGVDYR